MRRLVLAIAFGLTLALTGCAGAAQTSSPASPEPQPDAANAEQEASEEAAEMELRIDGAFVQVEWEDNQAVADLRALASNGPIVTELSMYGGFEQVGPLGASLTASDEQMTTAPGDIVLYAGDQISIFYSPHSWEYTRLGHITGKTANEMADLLGNDSVRITISAQ